MCAACAVFVIVLFLLLTTDRAPLYNNPALEGETVRAAGTVSTVRYRNDKLQIFLKGVVISDSATVSPHSADTLNPNRLKGIICYMKEGDTARPRIGSLIRVKGTFYNFERARGPGQFDMGLYYRARGIDASMAGGVIEKKSDGCDLLMEWLYTLRERLEKGADKYMSSDNASVLKAMLLGDKDALDEEVKGIFERSGCSHLLVISGVHIAVIGVGIYELLKRLSGSFTFSAMSGIALIILYGMMTGMGSATQRAIIMFAVCTLGQAMGRAYDIPTALSLAGVCILVKDPYLIGDGGFLLSFAAVSGIALVMPCFRELTEDAGDGVMKNAADTAFASLSVNIFGIPVMLHFFYRLPVYSFLLNLILVPTVGVLIFASIVFLICVLLCGTLPLGALCSALGSVCGGIIEIYIRLCGASLQLPGSLLITGKPPVINTAIYYLALGLLVLLCRRLRDKKRAYRLAPRILILLLPVLFILTLGRGGGMTLMALDVGQGDGIVAYTQRGCVITDCGSTDVDEVGKYRLIPALKALGIGRVNLIFVTHTDADHINGIAQVLRLHREEGIRVDALAMSPNSFESEAGSRLCAIAKENGVRVALVSAGDEARVDGMSFKVLFPAADMRGEPNELSLVTELSYGRFDALLTGDMEGRGEEEVCELLKDGGYELLKAPHHGSKNSGFEKFMHGVSPEVTFISCGQNSAYGHPHREALQRIEDVGSRIFVTAESGALIAQTDGEKLKIKTFLKEGEN